VAGALAAGSAPTLAIVGSDKDNDADDALGAAVQNAALEDIHVAEDEQELIRRHQSGRSTRRSSCAAPRTSPSARVRGAGRDGPGEE
jgi:hypothetical protein